VVIDAGNPADWPRRPISLRSGWTTIEVERLRIGGHRVQLCAEQGAARVVLSGL
jgi:hypothetical protein